MAWTGRKFAGIGCSVAIVLVIAAAGGITWYSAQMAGDFRRVKATEQALVAAVPAPTAFTPPADGVPDPARLEAFAVVRESTAEWRSKLADAEATFAASRSGWWGRAGEGHDLTQVMAGFWMARNEALTKSAMGPAEYTWLYGLVYFGWLGHDPAEGRQAIAVNGRSGVRREDARFDSLREQWPGGVPEAAAAVLEPLRERLVAGWTAETNPVDLVFIGEFEKSRDK
jgi:hypothetical protein